MAEIQVVEETLPLVLLQEDYRLQELRSRTFRLILPRIHHQVLVMTIYLGEKINNFLDL